MDYQDLVQQVSDLQDTSDANDETVSGLSDSLDDHEQRLSDIETNGAALEFPLSAQDADQITQLFPTGNAKLVAGVAKVNDSNIQSTSTVIFSVSKPSGTQGFLGITAQANGTMTITSTSNTDTSEINYVIFDNSIS